MVSQLSVLCNILRLKIPAMAKSNDGGHCGASLYEIPEHSTALNVTTLF